MTSCYYTIEKSSCDWSTAILNSEIELADSANLRGNNLNSVYEDANDQLDDLAYQVQQAGSTDDINKAQINYQEASAEYTNLETLLSSQVNSFEQTSSGQGQNAANAVQIASSIIAILQNVCTWLSKG